MTDISTRLLSILACPHDASPLELKRQHLHCAHGHSFPVVDGVPVLLRSDVVQTIGFGATSLQLAAAYIEGDRSDDWFIDSLGAHETEKQRVREARKNGSWAIDPVASNLIAATNGMLYRDIIGKVVEYPIPRIGLPPAAGETLLDIGCSWGRWSLASARAGYKPIGIDPSLGAVMAARRIARQLNLPFEGVVGDARYLPFRPKTFDAIFSYSVLQHFAKNDARSALDEASRVLRPGGKVLIQLASAYGARSLQHQIRRRFREPENFEVRYWTPRQLKGAFRDTFGSCDWYPDCYFGLGVQASDLNIMSPTAKAVVRASEMLKRAAKVVTPLKYFADSIFLKSGF